MITYLNLLDIFFSNEDDFWNGIENALGHYDESAVLAYCRPEEEFDYDHSLSSSARVEDSPMALFLPVIQAFKEMFEKWVDDIDITGIDKLYHLNPHCRYLSFNYTETLEVHYDIPADRICHIHGSRLNKGDQYIIGHNNLRNPYSVWSEDGIIFEEQAKENIITWMNDFVKDYELNMTMHNAFFDKLSDIEQIFTYGHSLDEIDWPYLEVIVEKTGKDAFWRISWFSDDDYHKACTFCKRFELTNVKFVHADSFKND